MPACVFRSERWRSRSEQRGYLLEDSPMPQGKNHPWQGRSRAAASLSILALIALRSTATVAAGPGPSAVFTTRCSGCHTFGQGVRVGPDLKGATDRHPREWLIAWVRSSEKLIQSGDPAAAALFRQYKQLRMPDHADLSDAEIGALIDYLAANGPEAERQAQIRPADAASPEDVKRGEQLFYGRAALASGDLACAACHALSREPLLGGTLAPDLTDVFRRYRDRALDQRLKRVCMPQ